MAEELGAGGKGEVGAPMLPEVYRQIRATKVGEDMQVTFPTTGQLAACCTVHTPRYCAAGGDPGSVCIRAKHEALARYVGFTVLPLRSNSLRMNDSVILCVRSQVLR
jgi:hypothetical protein